MNGVRLHRKILENLRPYWNYEDEALEAWSQTLAASRTYLEAMLPLARSEQPQLEWVRVLTTLADIADMGFPSPEDLEMAEGYARASVELAEQLDAPEELCDALGTLAHIYYDRGLVHEQLEVSRRRLAISRDPRFSDLRKRIDILRGLSDALMAAGEYAETMGHLLEKEELAIQIRDVTVQVWSLGLQAPCLLRLDRWDELLKLEEKRRELERRHSSDQLGGGNCVVLSVSAAALALQGDLDQARVLREQAYAFMATGAKRSTENWGLSQYYWMCLPLMAESEFAQVRDYLAAASNKPISATGLLFHNNEVYAMYLDMAVQQRDEAALRQYAPLVEETAARDGHILHQANAHRAWGVLHRLQAEYPAAETRLIQALELFQELETRWQIGRTLYELAELAQAQADPAESRDYFSRALTTFEEMGAVPAAKRTRTAMESLN